MRTHWLRKAGAPYLRRQVRQNLGTITGLAHVPREGGFVLVANHTSYLDHFVLTFLLEAIRERPTWFLTKSESFERPLGRAWAEAWNGIPVDRQMPSKDTVRTVRAVLRDGDAVCVYPEGTRNPKPEHLMDFRTGAFHFAVNADVPVVPIVMVGVDQVLPKGSRTFRRGRIDVTFGPPLQADSARSKPEKVKDLHQRARTWMETSLIHTGTGRAQDPITENGLAADATRLANNHQFSGHRKRALMFLVRSIHDSSPRNFGTTKALARTHGLAAADAGPLRSIALTRAVQGLRRSLRINPQDAETHYFLGAALMEFPRRVVEAAGHLEQASRLAEEQDPRPLLSLAQIEAQSGDPAKATHLLDLTSQLLHEHDSRTAVRRERIAALREKLEQAP